MWALYEVKRQKCYRLYAPAACYWLLAAGAKIEPLNSSTVQRVSGTRPPKYPFPLRDPVSRCPSLSHALKCHLDWLGCSGTDHR